ncbi:unnamed protein product [Sphagnum jensenii]|uniref:RING-type domain-containing protein n=1 Tax=Sphagnum jensenii TaxID=128206 RepID=A0ABP1ABL6_9BRYO
MEGNTLSCNVMSITEVGDATVTESTAVQVPAATCLEGCDGTMKAVNEESSSRVLVEPDLVTTPQPSEVLTSDLNSSPVLKRSHMSSGEVSGDACICAICRDKIKLEETSQVKGCEHSYCITCILQWAIHKSQPWCPQCRLPFTSLYVYRALDGSLNDYMFEESVCLLLRASWFKPPPPVPEVEDLEDYHEEDDCFDEFYFKSNVRIGNRRWGDNGYVRAGRREARPVGVRPRVAAVSHPDEASTSSSSSRQIKAKEKESAKDPPGRRAKRAQKREAADRASANRLQQHH